MHHFAGAAQDREVHAQHLRLGRVVDEELTGPQPYMPFLHLWKDAAVVLTDSGGLQEETTALGVPCVTLRDSTERPETVSQGTNELIGTAVANLAPAFERLFDGRWLWFFVRTFGHAIAARAT